MTAGMPVPAGVSVRLPSVTGGALPSTLWILVRYFTITTNILVVVVFGAAGLGRTDIASPRAIAGTGLSILLVGIVNAALLHGVDRILTHPRPDDILMHAVVPVLVPTFWLLFTAKGCLRLRDPFIWGLYPIGYLVYALARGSVEDRYAYPFIDVGRFGWHAVGVNVVAISIGFLAVGLSWVWIDGLWARDAEETAAATTLTG